MLKFLVYVEQAFRNLKFRWKGHWVKFYLLLHGCKVGKGLKCIKYPNFSLIPYKNISLGDQVTIGENILFEISRNGFLKINDGVNLTRNIVIVVNSRIDIGVNCLIAENVSIRDANHQTKKKWSINQQVSDIEPIIIGDDVWIGANSVILKGSKISKGCVIGANSLVLKKPTLEPYGIYGGTPLKLLKMRSDD